MCWINYRGPQTNQIVYKMGAWESVLVLQATFCPVVTTFGVK